MSRIDQAWNRHLRAANRGGALRPESSSRNSPLAQYPLERPSATVRDDAVSSISAGPPAPNSSAVKLAPPAAMAPPEPGSPFIRPRHATEARSAASRLSVVAPAHPPAYTRILSSLQDAHAAAHLRTVMVTGPSSREDIGGVATTLARALGELFPRVLLVDADATSPWLHRSVGVPLEPGLAEWSEGGCQVVPIVDIMPHLSVLTAGRMSEERTDDPTADYVDAVLDLCASTFDFVVLCTPPVARLPEARRIAHRLRAVVFVISGRTPFSESERSMSAFDRSLIIGTVLNGVDDKGVDETDGRVNMTNPVVRGR